MTQTEAKEFVRKHFEAFVNRKHRDIGKVNFALEFEDHGADVPAGTPPGLAVRFNMWTGPTRNFLTFT